MKIIHGRKFDANHLTTRDVLIILPLVLGLTALGIVFAFLVSDDTYIRWGGLAVDSAILFAYFVSVSRQWLANWRFWVLTACLLLLHLTGWIVFLMHIGEWRLAWFAPMIFELPVFLHLRNRQRFMATE